MEQSKIDRLKKEISEWNPDAVLWDDIDDAIIGIGCQHGGNYVVVYDKIKGIETLAHHYMEEDDTLDYDYAYQDAIEWFEYNIECAYVGENTPIIVSYLDGIK